MNKKEALATIVKLEEELNSRQLYSITALDDLKAFIEDSYKEPSADTSNQIIPFDLEKALSGQYTIKTDFNKEVKDIGTFNKSEELCVVFSNGIIAIYDRDGYSEKERKLVMYSKVKTVVRYINREKTSRRITLHSDAYEAGKSARITGNQYFDLIAIPVNITVNEGYKI